MTAPPTLDALAASHPEWRPWLRLYAEARAALNDPTWASVIRDPSTETDAAPLLTDATIAVDARRAGRFLRSLLGALVEDRRATRSNRARITDDEALALLGAAVAEDTARIVTLAGALDTEPGVLGVVATFAAMPVLHACRRSLAAQLPGSWAHGYCPLCGAWPTLAEARGVERTRRFRCARCGVEWYSEWLRCPYCQNADHARLAALVGADAGQARRVDTCEMCRGYVKTLAVLRATPPEQIALVDLASVELDLAALEKGYGRPSAPARLRPTRVVRVR
jgi:FdhE protein